MNKLKFNKFNIKRRLKMGQQLIPDFNINIRFILLVITAILLIDSIINFIRKTIQSKKNRKIINSIWGKIPTKKYIDSDFIVLSDFFKYKIKTNRFIHIVDDITWNDISMEKIFIRINNCLSTLGENLLYYILKTPILNKEDLNKRDKYIEFFAKNKDKRVKLQDIIINIGEERNASIINYLSNKEKINNKRIIVYITLSVIFILSLIGIIVFKSKYYLYIFLAFIIVNAIVYYRTSEKRQDKIQIVKYISKIVLGSKEICKLEYDEIHEYNVSLKNAYKKLKTIHWKSAVLLKPLDLDLLSFLKVFLLFELIVYEDLINYIYKYKKEIMKTYEAIGYIDALISIASYRESLECYTKPELVDNKKLFIDCKDIYHPLIKEPVNNSISTEKSILLTGSNATGKSTFLKTVAINSILAQTIYTCNAVRYRSSFFKTYTSMALKDNLFKNESYFIVEIKSLKRILNDLNNDIPVLCFIDEILRGTNTIERIAASSQVLKYLTNQNSLCFAATHDIELTDILKNYYTNYHFQEKIEDNKVIFDYKLHKDKARSRNAIKLLEIMEYDKKIIDDALFSIDEYTNKNEWNVL